jgi:hypothetical protein
MYPEGIISKFSDYQTNFSMNSKLILAALTAVLFVTGCKKDKEEDPQLDSNISQFNSDANYYKSESDQADNDINNSLSNIPGIGRLTSNASVLSSPLCGVTIDTSQVANKIIIYNFDGVTPCFSPSRTRAGQIKAELTTGNHWGDQGSVLTITYINFKVARLSDNKSITFNGVKTLKNINGNNWLGFIASVSTLKYQERALNIDVTFDNNVHATWNSARMTEWSYVPANSTIPAARIAFTATGDTTINGQSTVDSWGVNRFGSAFTTYYNSPIVSNTYCGLWRFNSGELTHVVNNATFNLKLGVDQNGNPTPYACAYGYKVSWTVNGNSNSVVISY